MQKLTRDNLSVKELTDFYAEGEIAIPEIQREFVWDAGRIGKLLESLYNYRAQRRPNGLREEGHRPDHSLLVEWH
jgi:uncharacterized protein with ParB-like and HNH nuclease domain